MKIQLDISELSAILAEYCEIKNIPLERVMWKSEFKPYTHDIELIVTIEVPNGTSFEIPQRDIERIRKAY